MAEVYEALIDKGYSEEEIEKALGHLEHMEEKREERKTKSAARRSEPEYKEKMKARGQFRRKKIVLTLQKAAEAGIIVTDEEIQSALTKD